MPPPPPPACRCSPRLIAALQRIHSRVHLERAMIRVTSPPSWHAGRGRGAAGGWPGAPGWRVDNEVRSSSPRRSPASNAGLPLIKSVDSECLEGSHVLPISAPSLAAECSRRWLRAAPPRRRPTNWLACCRWSACRGCRLQGSLRCTISTCSQRCSNNSGSTSRGSNDSSIKSSSSPAARRAWKSRVAAGLGGRPTSPAGWASWRRRKRGPASCAPPAEDWWRWSGRRRTCSCGAPRWMAASGGRVPFSFRAPFSFCCRLFLLPPDFV